MENTSSVVILLNILDISRETSWVLFSVLSLCYIFIITSNMVIIITVVLSPKLHKPMHVFLCNLAVADIVGSSTIIPKQMQMLASGNNEISFLGCIGQTFCINLFVTGESLSLTFISADRYLAICKPLRYHAILPLKRSMHIILLAWLGLFVANVMTITDLLRLQVKSDIRGEIVYCYSIYIMNLSVSDVSHAQIILSACFVIFIALPPCVLLYTFFRVCLVFARPSSARLSKKAKETLVTQLLVTSTYFMSIMSIMIRGRLKQSSSSATERKNLNYGLEFSVLIPAVGNTIIYGLRVTVLRKAIINLFQKGFNNRLIMMRSKTIRPLTQHD